MEVTELNGAETVNRHARTIESISRLRLINTGRVDESKRVSNSVICEKHITIYRQIENTVSVYHIVDTQTEYTKLFY